MANSEIKGARENQERKQIKKEYQPVLDACCGGRMMWFDKKNPVAVFQDRRKEIVMWDEGKTNRVLEINPDLIGDFTEMGFADNSFYLVVFDPPHLKTLGTNSRTAKMYGKLLADWETEITAGFSECFRVLKPFGVLIFKWNSIEISLSRVLEIAKIKPLFGHTTGRQAKTHWVCFMKDDDARAHCDAEARPDIKEGGALRTAGKRTACPSCKSHNVKCRGSIWNCEDCGERW